MNGVTGCINFQSVQATFTVDLCIMVWNLQTKVLGKGWKRVVKIDQKAGQNRLCVVETKEI